MWIKLGVYAKFVHFFMRDGSYMDVPSELVHLLNTTEPQ